MSNLNINLKSISTLVLIFILSEFCLASEASDFEGSSQQFHKSIEQMHNEFMNDPKKFMDRKRKSDEKIEDGQESVVKKFNQNQSLEEVVNAKDRVRKIIQCGSNIYCHQEAQSEFSELEEAKGRAGIQYNDNPKKLVDDSENMILKMNKIDELNLHQGRVEESPWSDDYWPIYQGVLGNRYASYASPDSEDWSVNIDWIISPDSILSNIVENVLNKVIKASNLEELLSPSEKYDLLIGNKEDMVASQKFWQDKVNRSLSHHGLDSSKVKALPQGFLTPANWSEGQTYFAKEGKVETWMGICHGWAPASYVMPRPLKSVTVKSYDEKLNIKFFPADIKALASYLFAQQAMSSRFIGGRCNLKDPEKDKKSGRIIDQNCFDTNPGTWHLTAVNQIGRSKKSFVFDATYDYEVWNQPMYSYKFTYFDPQSKKTLTSLDWNQLKKSIFKGSIENGDLKISYDSGKDQSSWNPQKDIFWDYRFKKDQNGKFDISYYRKNPKKLPYYIVGVVMEVQYMVEVQPFAYETDSSRRDKKDKVKYMYDLEINRDGEIIGGEWYSNDHPDFLWHLPNETRDNKMHYTFYDNIINNNSSWDTQSSLPKDWSEAAKNASTEKLPLAKIIDSLIESSRK